MATKKPTKAELESENLRLKAEAVKLNVKVTDMTEEAIAIDGRIRVLERDLAEAKREVNQLEHQLDVEKQARTGLFIYGSIVIVAVLASIVFL